MEWMYREFSSEVLLSAIEYTQFKAVLKEYGQSGDDSNGIEIIFYSEIPKSSIVHHQIFGSTAGQIEDTSISQNDSTRLTTIAGALYTKYIQRHSEMEINISYSLRNRWDLLHSNNYPEDDLVELNSAVDEVIKEMLKYIRQSFNRFKYTRR